MVRLVVVPLAAMVVFMIMASQFRSLRLPFIMLFTTPVAQVGILLAAGQASPSPRSWARYLVDFLVAVPGSHRVPDCCSRAEAGGG